MNYAKYLHVTEEEFYTDIHASVTEGATLTSDFDSVINFAKAGTYKVTLNAITTDGLEATPVIVLVHVAKSPAPIITADTEIIYTQNTKVSTTEFLDDINAKTNDGSPITSDLETSVNFGGKGNYVVTLRSVNEDGVEAVPVEVTVYIMEPPAPITSELTFDVDGILTTETIEAGSLVPEPPAPTKEGYTFIGWYDAKKGGKQWDFETDKMSTSDITLYAQFRENTSGGKTPPKTGGEINTSLILKADSSTSKVGKSNEQFLLLPATGYNSNLDLYLQIIGVIFGIVFFCMRLSGFKNNY
ncbi:LapB repeat-containing protein [Listeria monocytogenes]